MRQTTSYPLYLFPQLPIICNHNPHTMILFIATVFCNLSVLDKYYTTIVSFLRHQFGNISELSENTLHFCVTNPVSFQTYPKKTHYLGKNHLPSICYHFGDICSVRGY